MTVKSQPQIQLVPWDPHSEAHIDRLILQRIACGWHEEHVRDLWCKQQKDGHKSLYWIVLTPSPQAPSHIATHLTQFPQESMPLLNSAKSPPNNNPDTKNELPSSYIPIGHIALDSDGADGKGKLSYDLQNVFRISNFYISRALQGLKLGSLAMDEIEGLAMGKGRTALVLGTAAEEYPGRTEKFRAMGKEMPVHSIPKWYERRGYRIYKTVEEAWFDVDSTGKKWWISAVFMKKDIAG